MAALVYVNNKVENQFVRIERIKAMNQSKTNKQLLKEGDILLIGTSY